MYLCLMIVHMYICMFAWLYICFYVGCMYVCMFIWNTFTLEPVCCFYMRSEQVSLAGLLLCILLLCWIWSSWSFDLRLDSQSWKLLYVCLHCVCLFMLVLIHLFDFKKKLFFSFFSFFLKSTALMPDFVVWCIFGCLHRGEPVGEAGVFSQSQVIIERTGIL